MSKITDLVKEKINPIIEEMGYEIVDTEFAKKIDGMNLTFYIDNDSGITLDDCEKVHKAIDGPLDELNPTNDNKYILNVSSVGLDRPLKSDNDFKRNIGKKVDITLYKPLNLIKRKRFTGILLSFNSEEVFISEDNTEIQIPRKMIGNMVLHLDF